jgi:Skp family chaperone for outer membrane proteins
MMPMLDSGNAVAPAKAGVQSSRIDWIPAFAGMTTLLASLLTTGFAVEIPLESVSPVRIGYIDLQKVFDTYPEKAFAEGDLLKEIQKRKTELTTRQNSINIMRQQIASDEAALEQAKAGKAVVVPHDDVAALQPAAPAEKPAPPPAKSTATAVEPYPTEEPLAGLPGHGGESSAAKPLPGMQPGAKGSSAVLDNLAASETPQMLNTEAQAALQRRISATKLALDRQVYQFRDYRGKALEDMKQLQTQKTYGVMSRIYAVLQSLARDENITVVMDKAYVLYGEDTVDLSDKLIARLNQEQAP